MSRFGLGAPTTDPDGPSAAAADGIVHGESRRAGFRPSVLVVLGIALTLLPPGAPGQQGTDLAALLGSQDPLDRSEISAVLAETGPLLVGKTFFTYGGFGGSTITVGPGPRVRMAYYGDRADEWTGQPARFCDGSPAEGELRLRWRVDRSGWKATPSFGPGEEPRVLDGMFALWSDVPAETVEDAGFREVDGVRLRGLRYPYEHPADLQGASFEAEWQTVWLDPRTGLPVRYEIAVVRPEPIEYGYFLSHAPGWTGGPDASIPRPTCVPGSGGAGFFDPHGGG